MTPLTIQPASKDNTIDQGNPTLNLGSSEDLVVVSHDSNRNNRILLEVPLPASIPVGVTFSAATLSLYKYFQAGFAGTRTYFAYKLTRTDFVESQATWNVFSTGNNWATGGGDFVTSAPSGNSTTNPTGAGFMAFDVKDIVQDAYDKGNAVELLIKDDTEDASDPAKLIAIRSSQYTTDLTLRPKLALTWTEALTLTILPLTDISETTATGRAVIDFAGSSSITAHGFVWGTSLNPTLADSSVDDGAGVAGFYDSSITGLVIGVRYFMRAFATNSEGTVFSANVTFVAGFSNTVLLAGNIEIVANRLHYVGKDGNERWLEGELVR